MKKELLYQEVALNRNFAEYNLCTGDIATLIDFVPHPSGGEEGAVIEIFNAFGESISVVTVPISSIEAIHPDDVLSIRRLVQAL